MSKLKKIMIIFILIFIPFAVQIVKGADIGNNKLTKIKQSIIDNYKNISQHIPQDELIDKHSIIVRFKENALENEIKAFELQFNLKNKFMLNEDLKTFYYELPDSKEVDLGYLIEINNLANITLYIEPNYKYSLVK